MCVYVYLQRLLVASTVAESQHFDVQNIRVITKCLATSASSSVALGMLFGHKLYIIIYHPERNNRSAFTTAKGVRCHIGISGMGQRSLSTSGDSMDRSVKCYVRASGYRQL
jgi:hypothetical protein